MQKIDASPEHQELDSRTHYELLMGIVRYGHAPTRHDLGDILGISPEQVDASLCRLHDNHGLVLHPGTTEVWIAHPFSLSPTAVCVSVSGRVWWAPCIWCAMGIVAIAAPAAEIHTRLGGEIEALTIRLRDGALLDEKFVVHFAIPPREAWKNVVHYCATVLPFRHEADVDEWCARHRIAKGAIVPLRQVFDLGRAWYGRHLAPDWVKWTPAEAQAIFEGVGLYDEFWRLPQGDARRF